MIMKTKKDFAYYRWSNILNTVLQVVLTLVFFAGAMHLGSKFFWRIDLTENHRYSLSAETLSYLENLDTTVRVIVTIAPDGSMDERDQLYRDVRGLLREYEYAARSESGSRFQVEFVNIFQQRQRAQLIASEFGVEQEDLIIFATENRQRILFPNDIYVTRDRQRKSFRGEQIFTSALLDVTAERPQTLYFVTGHEEMRFNDPDPYRGLSQLGDALWQRNFKLEYLDLKTVDRVPEDADLVLLIAPRTPLLSREEEILRRYLANDAGRLLAMIDPRTRHGLGELFYEWGIQLDDVVVMDDGPASLPGGDLILTRYAEHPITQSLLSNHLPLIVGFSRSVREDPGRPLDDSISVQPLIGTSDTSWGERSYRQDIAFVFDPDTDLAGPLSIASVSERQIPSQLGINIPGGRLVVFGTSDMITNNRINSPGNLTLFLNAINWMVDRDTMTNIAPRPIDRIQLVLSRDEIRRLRLTLLGLLPGMMALCGVVVYWIRRK
jgi:ABC-type uncharacterized transport system involved in gliding motility auxiliary subunit